MLAAIRLGSSHFEVLAAALTSDVFRYTPESETHWANGVEWYFNGGSMGFAGAGDVIRQNSADIEGRLERDRLSWHTTGPAGYGSVATAIRSGYRAGYFTRLTNRADWQRVILTANAPPPSVAAPEPSSCLLLLIGGGTLIAGSRRPRFLRTP